MTNTYTMRISRLTVDKLGVKLYDRVSAVIAELVANSYDADAKYVRVIAPMDELLATKVGGVRLDKGYEIEVTDDGIGMTPEQVNEFYLKVGAERRSDPRRGERSQIFKRKVMGRKGVGKLAPFGVCQKIELITSGGERIGGVDENGKRTEGYLTAHLYLDRTLILKDTDEDYHPEVGRLDGVVRKETGTTLILRDFEHRRVPGIKDFARQLSQRFGVEAPNWRITLVDSKKKPGEEDASLIVGKFSVDTLDGTAIRFEKVEGEGLSSSFRVIDYYGSVVEDVEAGFHYEGRFYPVLGWVAYSKYPYKDDLMAGVRIYCRGKIAALTHIFNLKAGFTGEYDVRSYLVGELQADWLDEEEDLIRTDRQDILWSHELARAFEQWGQSLVKKVGVITRQPKRRQTWTHFLEVSDFIRVIEHAYPREEQREIRENSLEIAKVIAQTAREDELEDDEYVRSIIEISLMFGPYITLDRKLREAAEPSANPLSAVTGILKTARLAELAAFGRIADDRVRVIGKIEELKDNRDALESAFQDLISAAPWLINPQWSPVTANQSFSTLKKELVKFYKNRTGEDLTLDPPSGSSKRADFVLSSQDNVLQVIEIKRPGHNLANNEMERLNRYAEILDEFLALPGNQEFARLFSDYHITLVCDGLALAGVHKQAFEGLKGQGRLSHISWRTFLLRTRKMHESFLNEAQKQREIAVNNS